MPYGTIFSASIIPTVNGYHNGTLNITSGTVVSDTTISATTASRYRWRVTIGLGVRSSTEIGYRHWGGTNYGGISGDSGWDTDEFSFRLNATTHILTGIAWCPDDGGTPTYNVPAIYCEFPQDGAYLLAGSAVRHGTGASNDFIVTLYQPNRQAIGDRIWTYRGQNIYVYWF